MSTPLHTPSTTGRRGTGAPTPGRQPDQPHRHATGRRAAADPQHPVVSVHRPSAAPQRGGHCERLHQTAQQAQPAVAAILDRIRASPVVRRRNRLASKWEQRLRLDFQHPHRTLLPANATSCGGVGARRWWTKRWASHSPEYWSAISTPPTTITMAPSNGAGPTCCGISTTWWRSTQGHRAGPVGRGSPSALCRGQVFHPSSGTTTAHRSTGLGAAAAGHLPALPG